MERRGDGVPIINSETKALMGKHPIYRIIDGSDLFLTIPAAATEPSGKPGNIRRYRDRQ
jgi:hypothetical protein